MIKLIVEQGLTLFVIMFFSACFYVAFLSLGIGGMAILIGAQNKYEVYDHRHYKKIHWTGLILAMTLCSWLVYQLIWPPLFSVL